MMSDRLERLFEQVRELAKGDGDLSLPKSTMRSIIERMTAQRETPNLQDIAMTTLNEEAKSQAERVQELEAEAEQLRASVSDLGSTGFD